VKAHVEFEGTHAPTPAEIEFESVPALLPFCYTEDASSVAASAKDSKSSGGQRFTDEEKRKLLDEVEKQQTEFGTEN
jgi:beta-galactosidase